MELEKNLPYKRQERISEEEVQVDKISIGEISSLIESDWSMNLED